MTLWRKLANAFRPAFNVAQLLVVPGNDGREISPPASPVDLLKAYWGWMRHCAEINGNAVASTPLRLYSSKATSRFPAKRVSRVRAKALQRRGWIRTKGVDEYNELESHPALDLLEKPNPYMRQSDLLKLLCVHGDMVGNGYVVKQRGAMNRIEQLWPLPPQYMYIVPSRTELIAGYKWKRSAEEFTYAPPEIVHYRCLSPGDPYFYGVGCVASEAPSVLMHGFIDSYQSNTFKNGARPDIAVIAKNGIGKDEMERFRRDFISRYGGIDKAGTAAFIGGDVTIQDLNFSPRDVSYLNGDAKVMLRVSAAFGVPLPLVDPSASGALANFDAARTQHAELTVTPRLRAIEELLTASVASEFDPSLFFAFDECTPDNAEFRLKQEESHVKNKIRTVNEIRTEHGWEPVAWGDEPPPDPQPFGMSDSPPPPQTAKSASCCSFHGAASLGRKSSETHGEPQPESNSGIKRMASSLKAVFRKQHKQLADKLAARGVKSTIAFGEDDKNIADSEIDGLMSDWVDDFAGASRSHIEDFIASGGKGGVAKLQAAGVQSDIGFDVYNPKITEFIDQYTIRLSTHLTKTNQERLKGAIRSGLEAGDSTRTVADIIADQFKSFGEVRAEMIARTEYARATATGEREAWKESGVVEKVTWNLADSPCEICEALQAQNETVQLGAAFASHGSSVELSDGSSYTFDYEAVEGPPAHPQCRCFLTAELYQQGGE